MTFREFKVRRDPKCAVCGEHADDPRARPTSSGRATSSPAARRSPRAGAMTHASRRAARRACSARSSRRSAARRSCACACPACRTAVELWGKCEWFNPGGSVKDRTALSLVTRGRAQRRAAAGQDHRRLVVGQHRRRPRPRRPREGLRGRAVDARQRERRSASSSAAAYGARIIVHATRSPAPTARSLAVRERVAAEPGPLLLRRPVPQPRQPARPLPHHRPRDLGADGRARHPLRGRPRHDRHHRRHRPLPARARRRGSRVVAVEPDEPLHGLEGLKHLPSAIVPEIYDPAASRTSKVRVATEDGYRLCREVLARDGLLVGHSAGAALWAAREVARALDGRRGRGAAARRRRALPGDGSPREAAQALMDACWPTPARGYPVRGLRRAPRPARRRRACAEVVRGREPRDRDAARALPDRTRGPDPHPARGARARAARSSATTTAIPTIPARPSETDRRIAAEGLSDGVDPRGGGRARKARETLAHGLGVPRRDAGVRRRAVRDRLTSSKETDMAIRVQIPSPLRPLTGRRRGSAGRGGGRRGADRRPGERAQGPARTASRRRRATCAATCASSSTTRTCASWTTSRRRSRRATRSPSCPPSRAASDGSARGGPRGAAAGAGGGAARRARGPARGRVALPHGLPCRAAC